MEQGTVLITGSSGLIGQAVTRRFASKFPVVGFDVKRPKDSPASAEHLEVDITSEQSVRAALEETRRRHGNRIASVIHLAAYYSFSGEPSPMYDKITVEGSRRLMHLLRTMGFEVEQFVFSSTMLVHRPGETGQEISEDSPVDPTWPYPLSKVHAEKALMEEQDGIPVVFLRIAGVYDNDCHSIPIANHIQRIYERQITSRFFPGNPNHGQSYIHLEDLVDAIDRTVSRRHDLPERCTLLIGEDEAPTFNELEWEISCLLYGRRWHMMRVPRFLATAGAWGLNMLAKAIPGMREPFIKPWMIQFADDHYDLDISEARRMLRWEPRHRLMESLPKFIADLKRDPEAWYRKNKLEYPGKIGQGFLRLKAHPVVSASTLAAAVAGATALTRSQRSPQGSRRMKRGYDAQSRRRAS